MYRALVSFSGVISMARGDIHEIGDENIAKSLLKAGYIEPVEIVEVIETEPKEKAKTKTTKAAKTKKN
jgi:methanogenic corrinoid protein MtbC1